MLPKTTTANRLLDKNFQSISGYDSYTSSRSGGDNGGSASFTYRRNAQEVASKEFKFHGFFGPHANQREVYDNAAKDIVRGVMEGYNGTIFAYGQVKKEQP